MKRFICALTFITSNLILPTSAAKFNCSQTLNFGNFEVNSCCRVPEINLGDALTKCNNYINSLRKPNEQQYPAYAHLCYADCIYRETGALINNEIRMANVKSFLEKYVSQRDKDIVPQIIRSFESCLENIKSHMKSVNIKFYAKMDEGCSPFAGMIFSCVNAETFLHCPPKMWKNDHKCNFARSYAEQCNPLPHVPLPVV